MNTLLRAVAATALVAGVAFPAFAQDSTIGTLKVEQGTVMTSDGGEFNTAANGQVVNIGNRIMVAEGSSASITYPGCTTVHFTKPGVYTINRPPVCGAGGTESSVVASNAGFIGFAALIAATGIASSVLDDDENLVTGDQPVSR